MTATLADAARNVSEIFKSFEVRLHSQSRIGRMVNALINGDVIRPDDNQFPIALEGLRDIRVLDFALSQLFTTIDRTALQKKLHRVVKDSVNAREDLTKSPGRDIQAELYVAAVISKGGMCPKFGEPDILCNLAGQTFGVEVKRVKNETRFEEHFRKAVAQIEKARVRGVVAMDLSLAFNRTNMPVVTAANVVQIQLAHREARKCFVNEQYDQMRNWINGREVRGMIIIDHILRLHPQQGWCLDTFHYDVPFGLHNQRRLGEFEQFREAFMRGYGTPPIRGS